MNSNNSNIEDQLLLRYIQGDITVEERTEIEDWLHQDGENEQYLEKLKAAWERAGSIEAFDQIDVDENWKAVKSRLKLEETKGRQVFMLPKVLRYANDIVLLAAVTFIITQFTDQQAEMLTLMANVDGTAYELPDGTDVWLNAGSQLTYPSFFSSEERTVELVGEGFFEVVHNPEQPFVVKTALTKTKVLGTSFNLKAPGVDEPTELVLVTGKVQFSNEDNQIILDPGDRVIMTAEGDLTKALNSDLNFMAWKTRTLIFENTKMEQVVNDIARLYGIEIIIEQASFKACPLTTRFENESLESVLETIELLFGVEVSNDGTTYTMSGAGC